MYDITAFTVLLWCLNFCLSYYRYLNMNTIILMGLSFTLLIDQINLKCPPYTPLQNKLWRILKELKLIKVAYSLALQSNENMYLWTEVNNIWSISLMCSSHELIPLKKAFPELAKLIRIAMTITINTVHYERYFSTLKRIIFDLPLIHDVWIPTARMAI